MGGGGIWQGNHNSLLIVWTLKLQSLTFILVPTSLEYQDSNAMPKCAAKRQPQRMGNYNKIIIIINFIPWFYKIIDHADTA